jgi:hypothetical protein
VNAAKTLLAMEKPSDYIMMFSRDGGNISSLTKDEVTMCMQWRKDWDTKSISVCTESLHS